MLILRGFGLTYKKRVDMNVEKCFENEKLVNSIIRQPVKIVFQLKTPQTTSSVSECLLMLRTA